MERIRVAVVGCGYWGSKHVRVLRSSQAVEEVVLVDGSAERLAALGGAGVRAFPSLDQALPEVDAVVIATPPSTHVPLGLQAVAAGKHVLVEKPMATTTAAARLLLQAAEESGVVLMVGHTFEYNGAVWKLRSLIDSGELGDLYYIDTARLNLGLYQRDVNVIMDLAPHDISILNYLTGSVPSSVEAWGARHAHRSFEDVAYLRLYYDRLDLAANVHVSWLDPCKVRRLTAVGSRKMAVYNDLATEERIRLHDKGVLSASALSGGVGPALTEPPMSYRYGDITSPFVVYDEPLTVQDSHFLDCVQTGARPRTDGHNGVAVVRALECAQISLEQGRRVACDEVDDRRLAFPEQWDEERSARPREAVS